MTIHGRAITDEDMHIIAGYMVDEIRENMHTHFDTNEDFLREYIKRDPDILPILKNEFNFEE